MTITNIHLSECRDFQAFGEGVECRDLSRYMNSRVKTDRVSLMCEMARACWWLMRSGYAGSGQCGEALQRVSQVCSSVV